MILQSFLAKECRKLHKIRLFLIDLLENHTWNAWCLHGVYVWIQWCLWSDYDHCYLWCNREHFLQISLLSQFCLEHHHRWSSCWPTCQESWHPRALQDDPDARKELQDSREASARLWQCFRLRPLQTSCPCMAYPPVRQRDQASSPSSLRCCSTGPFRMYHPTARRRSPGWSRLSAVHMVYTCRSKHRAGWLQEGIYVREQARE